MKFYNIKLRSIPQIIFACSVSSENYKNKFSLEKDFLEISINTGGDYYIENASGNIEISKSGMIYPITQMTECKTYTNSGTLQNHITVGVDVEYECVFYNTDCNLDYNAIKDSVSKEGHILIPCLHNLGEKYDSCVAIIKKIIYKNTSSTSANYCDVLSNWFALTGKLTDIVLDELDKNSFSTPYTHRYIENAKKFISENLLKNLSVADIAAHLGISSGYLHSIFKAHLNMGITEYINYYKIQLAKQYIHSRSLSLKEISTQLGIDDPAYMSRLFKKTEGISYREYCRKYLHH